MTSPFPGMDPYLERYCGDVHTRFLVYASNQLNAQLPHDLQARVEESVSLRVADHADITFYPDVRIAQEPISVPSSALERTAETAEPLVLAVAEEPWTERHLEIVDLKVGEPVISVIEVLSPVNKAGSAGRAQYRQKQECYLNTDINLIEIDLVRAGRFVLAVPRDLIPRKYRSTDELLREKTLR